MLAGLNLVCFNGQMTAAYSYFNWVHHMITDIKLPVIQYDVVEDLWLVQRFVRKDLVKKKRKLQVLVTMFRVQRVPVF